MVVVWVEIGTGGGNGRGGVCEVRDSAQDESEYGQSCIRLTLTSMISICDS